MVQGEESTLTYANAKSSAFWMGVVTTLTNPKSALFVASVFATVIPSHPSLKLGLLATIVMRGISLVWYGAVACLFATKSVSRACSRGRRRIDRAAGGFFIVF